MSIRPHEKNRQAAAELADLIMSGSEDKEKITRLKQELGLYDNDSDIREFYTDFYEEDDPDDVERFGIWKLELINGQEYYVRDPKLTSEYTLWAKVPRIPPKGSKRRICFLGESVARGFLYSPQNTPAVVLEKILNINPDSPGSEVIDLSRTDCSMRELAKLVHSCFALNPDAVVIFAGNNWHADIDIDLCDDDYRDMIKVIENKSKFKELKRILEDKYIDLISNFIKNISDLSRAHGVPFIVIIPEFNLIDWHSNEKEKRLLFPQEEAGKWFHLKLEADQAMAQGDLEKVESICKKMIDLNEANPYCYEQIGQCKLKRNLLEDAVKYFRLAHDTTIFQLSHNPGILSVTQDTLLRLTHRYSIPVVDLVDIFNRYDEGMQPGRQLFLDYCHLSARGINIAMIHAAKCILLQLTGRDIPLDESKIREIAPDAREVGVAHVFAAIHNAHWGQSHDIVYYHCLKALESSDVIGDLMINYTSMANRHVPWVICEEFKKLEDAMIWCSYSLAQPEGQEILDIILVDAMTRALSTKGIDIKNKIDSLRKKEHGFINGKINLLESYYHQTFAKETGKHSRNYYQAFDVRSRFFLITGKDPRVLFQLTCRLPAKNSEDQWLELLVNNAFISNLSVSEEWSTHTIKIPQEVFIDGINTIIIQWPVINGWQKMERKKNETFRDLFIRRAMPIFGEIHMFWALKEED